MSSGAPLPFTMKRAIDTFGSAPVSRVEAGWDSGVLAARDFLPDVVLLDIGLPDMDGYEVCSL